MAKVFALNFIIFLSLILIAGCGQGGSSSSSTPKPSPTPSPTPLGSWTLISTPLAAPQIRDFAINKLNHWFISDRKTGFFRSTDQGGTWTQINSGIALTNGWTISYDSAHDQLIAGSASNGLGTGTFAGFYRSTDEGNSWIKIPVAFTFSLATTYGGPLFVPNGNIIFGGFWSPYPYCGAWVSTDGGQSTSPVNCSLLATGAWGLMYNPITNDLWMGTETEGAYRSTDNGFNWNQVSPSSKLIRDGDAEALSYDNAGNVLMGTQGGIWRSSGSNGSYTWANIVPNGNTSATRTIFRDNNGDFYYGHGRDAKNPTSVYLSTDQAAHWSPSDTGIPPGLEAWHFIRNPADGRLYVNVQDGKTNDGWIYVR